MVPIYIIRESLIDRQNVESITEEMIKDIIETKVEVKKDNRPESEK